MTPHLPLPWPSALAATRRPLDDGHAPHPGVWHPRDHAALDTDTMLAAFTTACENVGGQVHHIGTLDGLVALVRSLGDEGRAPTVMAWDAIHLPMGGVHDALDGAGIERLTVAVRPDTAEHLEDLARLDAATVGLTGAVALLADTGSVVVMSGPGRPRLASLLPPVHVALVTRAQLVPSLGAWLAMEPTRPAAAANCVAITGPSRTADIEMTLTRGVHGPRAIHVVFVS